jgi:DNA polymerase-3 subunit gamma/tau
MSAALSDLAVALQRIATIQAVPDAGSKDWPALESLLALASRMSPEEVQLDYDIALRGRSEMPMAPDEYAGFTMTLLRMLAFAPDQASRSGAPTPGSASKASPKARPTAGAQVAAPLGTAATPAAGALAPALQDEATHQANKEQTLAVASAPAPAPHSLPSAAPARLEPRPVAAAAAPVAERAVESRGAALQFDGDWLQLVSTVRVTGLTRQLLEQAELVSFENNRFELRVAIKHLADRNTVERLKAALVQHFGGPVELAVQVGTVEGNTKAQYERGERDARQARAVASIESDPFVRTLVSEFDAVVVPGSIRPV